MIKWSEIESFHQIRKHAKNYPDILKQNHVVSYKCKVKLHGTNAGIQCHKDGTVIAQSRTMELHEKHDNCGFWKWVEDRKEFWNLKNDLLIFGEFIGQSIQKNVAVSQIPNKSFVVFAARSLDTTNDELIIEPEALSQIIKNIPDTYVLPWYTNSIEINWLDSADSLKGQTNSINEWVESVEANDPWVEQVFNIKGTGEGLVFYPVSNEHLGCKNYSNLSFKAKGEKHKNISTAKPAETDPQTADSIDKFVDMVLTPARLEQGARLVNNNEESYDMKNTGKFIEWIAKDIQKEALDEMNASNLQWKQVHKNLGTRARDWYTNAVRNAL